MYYLVKILTDEKFNPTPTYITKCSTVDQLTLTCLRHRDIDIQGLAPLLAKFPELHGVQFKHLSGPYFLFQDPS